MIQGTKRVVVVGAGPSGLFAAERLAAEGLDVTVFERMPTPGRKFLLAGRGGLNLTHSEALDRFKTRYGPEAARLGPLLEAFSPSDLQDWCRGLGQEPFTGTSGRVFPSGFKASPLLRAWLRRLEARGVRLEARKRWLGWSEAGALRFEDTMSGKGVEVEAPDALVLALGGASWPRLGADGGWVGALQQAGVTVMPLRPANCGFTVAWSPAFAERFAGTPLKTVGLSFQGRTLRGHATVTAQGLEGGAVYTLSRDLRDALERGGPNLLSLDLAPDRPVEALTVRLSKGGARQSLSNRLRKAGLVPLAGPLLRETVSPGLPGDPTALAALLKAVPIRVTGTAGLERAISTAGGVAWDALDDDLMLRARPGVFLAGEMLDWEAPTGGYLLQASFATAHHAALCAAAYASRRSCG
ncbi:MAG: NAD(P)/FAD-dependent oxidoreductase [Alphaproteobacteria bacterium]